MTETIDEMRKRHECEIEELQSNCTHPKSTEWSEWYWALGHKAITLRRWCVFCGALTGEKDMILQDEEDGNNG